MSSRIQHNSINEGGARFFKEILEPTSSVVWDAPIAYLIKKTPFATAFGDARLDAAGGFSLELKKMVAFSIPRCCGPTHLEVP